MKFTTLPARTQPSAWTRVWKFIRENLALEKQNGGWAHGAVTGFFSDISGELTDFQTGKSLISLLFLIFLWSESIRVDPSWSELIRPGLVIRVDPVRLLYLPITYRLGFCFAKEKSTKEKRPKVTKWITKQRENALASALAKTHQCVDSLESTRCQRVLVFAYFWAVLYSKIPYE